MALNLDNLPRTIEVHKVSGVPRVRMIDQRLLPYEEVYLETSDWRTVVDAIKTLAVRGAPAIGVAGAAAVMLRTWEFWRPGAAAAQGGRPRCWKRQLAMGPTCPQLPGRSASCASGGAKRAAPPPKRPVISSTGRKAAMRSIGRLTAIAPSCWTKAASIRSCSPWGWISPGVRLRRHGLRR